MNMRTTLMLAAVAVVGALIMLFTPSKTTEGDSSDKPDADKKEQTYVLSPKLNQDDILRLMIERPDKPRLAFERSGKKDETGQMEPWSMTEPSPGATETWTVQGVVSGATELTSERSFKAGSKDGVSIADAGMQPAAFVLTLIGKDGKEHKLEIGRKVPMSNDTYVRAGGSETLHAVARDFSYDLKREPSEYRGKSPFKIARNFAQRVEVEYDGKLFDLAKGPAEDWVMNSPAKAYAASEKVKNIVNAVGNLRLDKFVEDTPQSLATFGLDKPYLRVKIVTEEKKLRPTSQPAPAAASAPAEPQYDTVAQTHELLVGGTSDVSGTFRFIKLADQNWIATAPNASVEQMVPKDVRDPRVTRVAAAAVSGLEVAMGGNSAALALKDGRWVGEGDLADVDGDAVRNVLEAFEDLKAIDFVDKPENAEKYGLNAPRATLKVSSIGAVEPTTLLIGTNTPSGRNTYVQLAGQSGVQVITAEAANRLLVEPLSLRSRQVFGAGVQMVTRIEQQRGDQTVIIERAGPDWNVLQPQGAAPDPGGTRDIANDLSMLRAKKVAAKGDFEKFGFNQPAGLVRFTVEKPAAPPPATQSGETPPPASAETVQHTLQLARTPTGVFARKDEDPFVFEIDETVFKSLTGELLKRQLFAFDAKNITKIKIESNNGMVEFASDNGNWTYTPDPSVKLQQKKVADFAAEIAAMRIERYIAYSTADIAATIGEGAIVASITLKEGDPVTLRIDQTKKGELPRMAGWIEQKRVFLMRPGDVEKLIRNLDYYCKEEPPVEAEDAPPLGPGGQPGLPGAPPRPGGAPRPGGSPRPGGGTP